MINTWICWFEVRPPSHVCSLTYPVSDLSEESSRLLARQSDYLISSRSTNRKSPSWSEIPPPSCTARAFTSCSRAKNHCQLWLTSLRNVIATSTELYVGFSTLHHRPRESAAYRLLGAWCRNWATRKDSLCAFWHTAMPRPNVSWMTLKAVGETVSCRTDCDNW